jgi:outer membrane immunogenic protein
MGKAAIGIVAVAAVIATPVLAADMAVKAPPPAPAPVPSWSGFYGGIEFGGGWSNQGVTYSANDPAAAGLATGGQQPLVSPYTVRQSGPVGGFEAGYNWQVGSNWLLGLETDFSFAGMSGQASATSTFSMPLGAPLLQSTTTQQQTDWYGTARGRLGWLATPNLLLFGTGGLGYGRVSSSENLMLSYPTSGVLFTFNNGGFSFVCNFNTPCSLGASSAIKTGWTAGGGAEWLLDQHWSAKIEYQLVSLGTETVRVTAITTLGPGTTPASFSAIFRDQFNVVRLGLNYRF